MTLLLTILAGVLLVLPAIFFVTRMLGPLDSQPGALPFEVPPK